MAHCPGDAELDQALANLMTEINAPIQSILVPSIDDSIETVDATSAILRTLKSRIDRQLVKLAHRRNSLQPINIIPEEISVAIFHRAVAGLIPWRDSDVNALWVLARVQTYWWHLIKNHASFWTDIQARSSPHANRFKLRNSQNAPLTIRYKREDPADGIPQFIDGIALQTHRWKSLVWTGPFLDMLLEYLERPLPMLEHLDLAYQPEEIGGVPILNVQVIGGPRLRTVHTKSLSLPFAQLTTLVDLAIEDLPDSALLPSTLIDILLACTNLQNLKLDCISSSALAAPNLECGLVNSLSLKVLYLDNTSSAVITTLLRCIPVEKLGELTVAFRTSDSEDNTIVPPPTADLQAGAGEILDQLLQPRVSGSSTLYILLDRSSIQQVKIFIEPWAFTILFTVTGEQETWLRLEGVPLRRTLRGLASLPLAIHRVELFYEAPDDDVGEKIDSTFFEAYPNVVKFGFICPNQLIVQIFRWLSEQEKKVGRGDHPPPTRGARFSGRPPLVSEPQELPDGSKGWLWPNLAIISLPYAFGFTSGGKDWAELRPRLHELVQIRKALAETAGIIVQDYHEEVIEDLFAYNNNPTDED